MLGKKRATDPSNTVAAEVLINNPNLMFPMATKAVDFSKEES